ncbi:hypothetical protein [Radiobacillus sp. PE A8.2]|uniref:hypothetical protein n=1 Tax=Radiobacillus sp. PE A8.2 TaxID=3380349 RepID=UPI00389042BE
MEDKAIVLEIERICVELKRIHDELVEMSHEIQYLSSDENAEDHLKVLAGRLIEQTTKLYPMDY